MWLLALGFLKSCVGPVFNWLNARVDADKQTHIIGSQTMSTIAAGGLAAQSKADELNAQVRMKEGNWGPTVISPPASDLPAMTRRPHGQHRIEAETGRQDIRETDSERIDAEIASGRPIGEDLEVVRRRRLPWPCRRPRRSFVPLEIFSHAFCQVNFQRKAYRRAEFGFYFADFSRLYYKESPFGDRQGMHWNVTSNEKFSSKRAPLNLNVRTVKASEMLKTLCWDKVADFLVYLSDYASQKGFVALAVTAK
jgi:hypothetical protein